MDQRGDATPFLLTDIQVRDVNSDPIVFRVERRLASRMDRDRTQ